MPKRKERMAGYIRESDPTLADSTTIESQAKAVREYGKQQGYIYEPQHEFREALSAYQVPYMQRPQLLKTLKAAERHEFDVLVVSEIRAISRRQVEVLIIYDMLLKWGVRLETVKEKFAEDAMGKAVLSLRAMFVEIEREQSYWRMERGKADRIAIGHAPNGAKPAYGYILVDTLVEVKGAYQLNLETVYTDENGRNWTRGDVCVFIFDVLQKGGTLHGTANLLNDMGVPPPGKGKNGGVSHWTPNTIYKIVTNPIYTGEAWANRYRLLEKRTSKNGKVSNLLVERPKEEWISLPPAPALIDKESWEKIQKQLAINKEESVRNNKHEQLGLLRGGYIFCGICNRRMNVHYPNHVKKPETPRYQCQQRAGGELGAIHNHITQIRLPLIEKAAREKIVEVLMHPEVVRAMVAEIREENKPMFDPAHIQETIENIRKSMRNLYKLAENATDDETMADLTQRMNNLERQKREAEGLLYELEEDEEARDELEKELVKFETWGAEVRPLLTDPTYMPSYNELRLAIRILGLKVIVYPTQGDWPFRYHIDVTVPEVFKKLNSFPIQPYML